jgi:hypothetical protein
MQCKAINEQINSISMEMKKKRLELKNDGMFSHNSITWQSFLSFDIVI